MFINREPGPFAIALERLSAIRALSASRPLVVNTGAIASSALFAAHQLVATAAIQRSVLTMLTTPRVLNAALLLADLRRLSPTGPALTDA